MGRFLLAGLAIGFGLAIPLALLFLGIRWYDDQRAQKEAAAKEATATTQAVVARQATATAAALPHCTAPSKIAITNLRTFARPSQEPKSPNTSGFSRSYYASYNLDNTCNYSVFYQLDYTVKSNGRTIDTFSTGNSYIASRYGSNDKEIKVFDYTSQEEVKIDVQVSPIIKLECQSEENYMTDPTENVTLSCKKGIVRN